VSESEKKKILRLKKDDDEIFLNIKTPLMKIFHPSSRENQAKALNPQRKAHQLIAYRKKSCFRSLTQN
jgi:hypothetical protein